LLLLLLLPVLLLLLLLLLQRMIIRTRKLLVLLLLLLLLQWCPRLLQLCCCWLSCGAAAGCMPAHTPLPQRSMHLNKQPQPDVTLLDMYSRCSLQDNMLWARRY
jgi:hypothetical protein